MLLVVVPTIVPRPSRSHPRVLPSVPENNHPLTSYTINLIDPDVKICPAANVDLSSGLPPPDPLSDLPSGLPSSLPSGRPAFATDRDWIIWLMENPDQVNEGDRHRFAGIRHTGSFQLLLKSLEFPFSDIADDIESLFS